MSRYDKKMRGENSEASLPLLRPVVELVHICPMMMKNFKQVVFKSVQFHSNDPFIIV